MESSRCPVCQARYRGTALCSRCSADLSPLMLLAEQARRLRNAARQALRLGDAGQALSAAQAPERLHHTPSGAALERLAASG